MASCFMYFGR